MTATRRTFLTTTAAAGTITLLPWRAGADGHAFKTGSGEVAVTPVSHATFAMSTPMGTILVDPVGDPAAFADFGPAVLTLVTHRHGDHYNAETLQTLQRQGPIVTCQDVFDMMPADLQAASGALAHGGNFSMGDIALTAIPAYNLDPASKFHPKARRDNGFVLTLGGFRIYISGDTEDIPEMRALEDIDLAFVCMNLPFTMTSDAAASAVVEFKPKFVYPYHYRGKDGGTQDPKAFAAAVGDAAEVRLVDWYPDNPDL